MLRLLTEMEPGYMTNKAYDIVWLAQLGETELKISSALISQEED